RERVVLVFAGRDPAGGQSHRAALAGVPVVRVGPLDPDTTRALVEQVAVGLVPVVAEAVARLSGGNPLAAVELAGALTPGQGAGLARVPDALPPNGALAGGYLARARRLPAPTRAVLVLAAADDQLAVPTLLRAAAEQGLDAGALEPAEQAGLV